MLPPVAAVVPEVGDMLEVSVEAEDSVDQEDAEDMVV
jgi:hypothetical protein